MPVGPVILGFLPLMYWHLGGLLEKPHYQFLVLMPVTVWILVTSLETVPLTPVNRTEGVSGLIGLLASLLMLGAATVLWSPWIAACGAILCAFSLLLTLSGWRGVRNWFPVWVFSFILIPLPFGMDQDLIVRLRDVTTRITSSVLDQLGILHDQYANVIELPNKPLFIADACSGIHSLYVLMAATLFLTLWLGRGVIHTLILLASTFGLVLVENVARIALVAVLWQMQKDFSIGWQHEALGVFLFVTSLLLIVTTDQLLLFLLPQKIPSLLNWSYQKLSGEKSAGSRKPLLQPVPPLIQKLTFVVAALFPVLAVAQLARMPDSAPNLAALLYEDFDLPSLGREALPEEINGFVLAAHEEIQRVPGDPLGQASQQWTYRKGNMTAQVSLDYPYDNVHDLCECYSAIGWEVPGQRIAEPEELDAKFADVTGPLAIGQLNRNLHGHALLLYNLTDTAGNTGTLIRALARGSAITRADRRLESFASEDTAAPLVAPPWIQSQLFARTLNAPTPEEEEELKALFFQTRKMLFDAIEKSRVAQGGN